MGAQDPDRHRRRLLRGRVRERPDPEERGPAPRQGGRPHPSHRRAARADRRGLPRLQGRAPRSTPAWSSGRARRRAALRLRLGGRRRAYRLARVGPRRPGRAGRRLRTRCRSSTSRTATTAPPRPGARAPRSPAARDATRRRPGAGELELKLSSPSPSRTTSCASCPTTGWCATSRAATPAAFRAELGATLRLRSKGRRSPSRPGRRRALPRRPLVRPSLAARAAGGRFDRRPASTAERLQDAVLPPAARHRRSAHRQAHRLRRRHPRHRRARAARRLRRLRPPPSRCIR